MNIKETLGKIEQVLGAAVDALRDTRIEQRLAKINLLLPPEQAITHAELFDWSMRREARMFPFTEWLYVFIAAGLERNDALLAASVVLHWLPDAPRESSIFGEGE